ncbi:hypothetical protein L336_0010 [Candidatus Saccharimonas aalborgensis]|uniref:Nudix hydrolase domain-containing protein n=1 Tax=Candidatus Saccharimonas aalborgensis TaxID=1332188 RepID=R4PVG6_9BACT|nr:GrpB family protein [Candidatus Saccharimonas aalborgensis]AGL61722.1 hypothetical protein L336_0010 [Candidatus Saccharimonas aalborgensis]QQR51522.1 MAG: GrpB family protein [Candidatus Saccharibacteria bacterium]QQS68253.1 MAG: GrpB family protein [Candidatus Saccharibacteria bacterium]QQS70577.1 MAG: GrpB family protein [Candidatus Saccharibacteria bacterium]
MAAGLARETVKLVNYSRDWPSDFLHEKELLQPVFSGEDIHHVGSTAVQGLVAKPIIDILIGVDSFDEVYQNISGLEALGYHWMPERIKDWEIFVPKGPDHARTHYLHIVLKDSPAYTDVLAFRNYLRTHSNAREEYAALKRQLAEQHANNREAYTAAKSGFICSIIERSCADGLPIILSQDQHELGLVDPKDRAMSYTRHAARVVLINGRGEIALMHFTKTGSYKLPGGGIKTNEDRLDGLRREVQEEAGYTIHTIVPLGVVIEQRYFDGMRQISYCYRALTDQFVGTNLTQKEAAQGMELVWVPSYAEAIRLIQSATTTDEDGSKVGLEMMKRREVAILNAALAQTV